jgi:hypothetical protein
VDQLLRMMMAFTIMQGHGQGGAGEDLFAQDSCCLFWYAKQLVCLAGFMTDMLWMWWAE